MNQPFSFPSSSGRFLTFSRIFKVFFPLSILLAPLYRGGMYLWSFSIPVFISTALFYLYWIYFQKSSHAVVIHTRLDALIALYLFFFILSGTQTQNSYKTVVELFKTLSIFCVFWATLYYCRDRQNIRSLATAITLFGGAISFYGLLQLLGALPKYWWHRRDYLSSVYVSHNHFAGLLEIILPISIGLILAEEDRSKKILISFMSGLMGMAFVLSLSRGGFLSMTPALGFMILMLGIRKAARKKAIIILIALMLIVVCVAALFGLVPILNRLETLKNIGSTSDLSIIQRLLIWKGTVALISRNFWFGTGPGTFESAFFKFRPQEFIARPGFVHNDYLQLWADCGIFVFLITVTLFITLFYKGLRIIQKDRSILSLGIAGGCLTSIVAWAIHSLVDFNFHNPANWLFFTVASGILLSLGQPKGYSASFLKITMRIVISLTCILVLIGCVFFGISDYFLWKGRTEYKREQYPNAIASLSKSIRINPFNAEPYYLRAASAYSLINVEKDLLKAVHLDPYEPYYHYALAKYYLKSSKPEEIVNVLPYVQKMIQKDAGDPKLLQLSAEDLLTANQLKDKVVERKAKEMLKSSMELDPSSAFGVYEILWRYEKKIKALEEFNQAVPAGLKGFVKFLEEEDLVKYYRKYYLLSLGIDPDEKYRLSVSGRWNNKPSESFSLKEFDAVGSSIFFKDDFFYSNGLLEKKITIKNSLCRLELKAKGTRAGNSYPVLVVRLDGKVVDLLYIDSQEFIHFFSIFKTSPGDHVLGIEFINDKEEGFPKRDRNIWIKTIDLYDSAD